MVSSIVSNHAGLVAGHPVDTLIVGHLRIFGNLDKFILKFNFYILFM